MIELVNGGEEPGDTMMRRRVCRWAAVSQRYLSPKRRRSPPFMVLSSRAAGVAHVAARPITEGVTKPISGTDGGQEVTEQP